jgi:hypothetical protein
MPSMEDARASARYNGRGRPSIHDPLNTLQNTLGAGRLGRTGLAEATASEMETAETAVSIPLLDEHGAAVVL